MNWTEMGRGCSAATVVTLDFPSAAVAEFVGGVGCDAIAIDLEHATPTATELADLARACQVAGVDLVGRIRCRQDRVLLCLDSGINVLELTEVSGPGEVEDVVGWASFPPHGSRGIGRARANRYGHAVGGYPAVVDRVRQAGIDLIVHVETVGAVGAVKALAAHPWVKALVVGVHDLAASAGHPGRVAEPEVQQLVDAAITEIRASEACLGLSASTAADARSALDRGAALLLISQARLLSGALASVTDTVRREGR